MIFKSDNENLNIGTCSWKYDSWKGIVYSESVGKNYLSEYAKQFNLVEVDQWFWSYFNGKVVMPKPDVVQEYADSVPKDFKFSVKVPNAITLTHPYAKGTKPDPNPHFMSTRLFEDFLTLLDPIVPQVDSFIFQFEYLNKDKLAGRQAFLDKLHDFFSQAPAGLPYCIETRNKNYFSDAYFESLNTMGLSHVFLQGYWMPSIFDIYKRFGHHINDFTVIRLHGPDRKGIEKQTKKKWHQIVAPKDNELGQLSAMVQDLLSRNVKVSLNVNNHYEGSAPLTIGKFLGR